MSPASGAFLAIMPPYRPGQPPKRTWNNYSPHQEACWQAIDTVYHGHYFGYGETCQPSPGASIDPVRYAAWVEKFEAAWEQESKREVGYRGLTAQDLGDDAMRHLYERFTRAEALRQQAYQGDG